MIKKTWLPILILILAGIISCNKDPQPGQGAVVRFLQESEWDSLSMDMFQIDTAYLEGDSLRFTISYSGGCRDHGFILWKLPPSALYPQDYVELLLEHEANGDMCEAWITEELSFSLIPLQTDGEGEVKIMLRGTPIMSAYYGQFVYRY